MRDPLTPVLADSNATLRASAPRVRSRRGRARGVVFVEAVIIIATMTLFLMAIMFFRSFFTRQIDTLALARGAAIAYSMGGCEANDPTAWIARDLGSKTPSASSQDDPVPKDTPPVADSQEAQGIMNALPATGNDDSFLNPVAQVGLSGESSVTIREGGFGPRRGFIQQVSSTSYVSCGDVVREGDFEEMVDVVTDFF